MLKFGVVVLIYVMVVMDVFGRPVTVVDRFGVSGGAGSGVKYILFRCGIKCIRNGCSCKRVWFTPKSMKEYRCRKEAKKRTFEIKMGFGQQQE
ncbi:unnamed protein product [Adineta ricciae]|uniref:Secreted protein n=1 Tax=Adineta ricciae TaxID=249248 RepID=A0A813S2M5_ADIRI|nr:unnamed protein product [Adineta ricciae]CAF1443107.1 unnamed protein product [Adineta ricciae]